MRLSGVGGALHGGLLYFEERVLVISTGGRQMLTPARTTTSINNTSAKAPWRLYCGILVASEDCMLAFLQNTRKPQQKPCLG